MKTAQKIIEAYDGGSLYLSGCDLTGITLPTSIGGSLDLSGCDLTGITLPTSIGGSLDLSGCDLTGITLPTRALQQQRDQRRTAGVAATDERTATA